MKAPQLLPHILYFMLTFLFFFFFATHKSETQSSAESALCLEIKQLINCTMQSCSSWQFHTRKHTPLHRTALVTVLNMLYLERNSERIIFVKYFPAFGKFQGNWVTVLASLQSSSPIAPFPPPRWFLGNFYLTSTDSIMRHEILLLTYFMSHSTKFSLQQSRWWEWTMPL